LSSILSATRVAAMLADLNFLDIGGQEQPPAPVAES
jgi:hypothetical protein